MIENPCKHCGKPESAHHELSPYNKPDSCVCEEGTWDIDSIPPPCLSYEGDGVTDCNNCEHDPACHTDSTKQKTVKKRKPTA